ncbi:SprT family zinc-dependent metalloprotease [Nodosilinea sp. P-1105]|uniref:M48 family metallopeptidase n=1 Tax=Nodosilinea sp. P-1105 TaxID=2546229 RepID=UPI00146EAE13|nr:SprT family zinc-dependent metalloprotease [Nodosilinea sp. P-1105]NMF83604.1 M48 family peptidase [Nodosilinea sp. P-1105]
MADASEQLKLFHTVPPGLPDYGIRESARAKHVSIKIHLDGAIEVVVPRGFDHKRLPELLEKRRDWLWQTKQNLEQQTADLAPHHFETKPEIIELRSRQQTWQVLYQHSSAASLGLTQPAPQTLLLRGNTDNTSACTDLLRQWLTRKARAEFAPWLRELSFDRHLPFGRVSIRGQKTRWASCSTQKNISLNYKLLFLPSDLVHYVFVHELCHTVHMNHSKVFWQLVGEKLPHYQTYRDRMRDSWQYVPRWVEK